MQRRSFMAAVASAIPLSSRPTDPWPSGNKRKSPRQRGFAAQIIMPKGWAPKSWRDVPKGAFTVDYVYDPAPLAKCRAIAKTFNLDSLKLGSRLWVIVIATDGRLAKGGAA
jgi:hypothetical protein